MSQKGKVKFYDPQKKFGFIEQRKGEDVHIGPDSFKGRPPSEGDVVEFEFVKGEKGLHAKNVKILGKQGGDGQHYKLPVDTRGIVNPEEIDNFALRLEKTPYHDIDDKNKNFKFYKVDKSDVKLNVQPDYSESYVKNISNKHEDTINRLEIKTDSVILKPDWRLIIGLGRPSVYETSITLHHVYGIPYIPGSAFKGVIRNFVITEKFGKNDEDELDLKKSESRALEDPGFCDIFGCPKESYYEKAKKGKIIFFDSYPISKPNIEPDIMNPHYSPYYSEDSNKTPPADYHNPTPIHFLTVKDTDFRFFIGIREADNKKLKEGKFKGETPLSVAVKWLKKSMSQHGIGAKTAVGYGYMTKRSDD